MQQGAGQARVPEEHVSKLQAALATGSLAGLLEPWLPWWRLPEAATLQLACTGEPLVQTQTSSTAPGASQQGRLVKNYVKQAAQDPWCSDSACLRQPRCS